MDLGYDYQWSSLTKRETDIIYFIMNVHKTTYKAILNKNPNKTEQPSRSDYKF